MKKHRMDKGIEGVDNMTATLLEKDRVDYIEGMKSYLEQLKNKPEKYAQKEAKESLNKAKILTKKGEYTIHYKKNME